MEKTITKTEYGAINNGAENAPFFYCIGDIVCYIMKIITKGG